MKTLHIRRLSRSSFSTASGKLRPLSRSSAARSATRPSPSAAPLVSMTATLRPGQSSFSMSAARRAEWQEPLMPEDMLTKITSSPRRR